MAKITRRQWIVIIIAGAVAGGIFGGVDSLISGVTKQKRIDGTVEHLRELPFFGVVMKYEPEAEAQVRAAVEERIERGPESKALGDAGRQIRQKYAMPALRAAQDSTILALWTAQAGLAGHLQSANPAVCKEHFSNRQLSTHLLDEQGKKLLNSLLSAQEAAYLDGRGKEPKPTLSDERVAALFGLLALPEEDAQAMASIDSLPDAQACAVGNKLYTNSQRLPLPDRAELARFIITAE